MCSELEVGDWIIMAMKHKDKSISVSPPGKFRHLKRYVRNPASNRERFLFYLSIPPLGEDMTWQEFRAKAKSLLPTAKLDSPRTRPVRDDQVADQLRALWTRRGRIAR